MWGVPGVFYIPTWHREYHNDSDSSSSSSPTFHCISVLSTPVIIPMWGVPGVFYIPTWHREYYNHSDSSSSLSPTFHCTSVLSTPVIIPNVGDPGVFLHTYLARGIPMPLKAVPPGPRPSSIMDLSHNTVKV